MGCAGGSRCPWDRVFSRSARKVRKRCGEKPPIWVALDTKRQHYELYAKLCQLAASQNDICSQEACFGNQKSIQGLPQ